MSWTDERVELLKKMWSEGQSASQIAKELGAVTRNAVIGKVHRLGLSNRVGGPGEGKADESAGAAEPAAPAATAATTAASARPEPVRATPAEEPPRATAQARPAPPRPETPQTPVPGQPVITAGERRPGQPSTDVISAG